MLLNLIATTSRTTQSTLYVVDAAVAAGVVVDVVLCHTYICATSAEKIWVDPILKASLFQTSQEETPMLR